MIPPSIPQGLDLIPSASGQVVRKVWMSWILIPLVFFMIAWDGFLIFWYAMATRPGAPLIMKLFPLLHVAVGIGLTYYVIASFFNKTDITISLSGVEVKTSPLPWPGNKFIRCDQITDILVRERVGSKGSRSYRVMYVDPSRKERYVTGYFQAREQAEFVATLVRQTLNLE